MDCHTHLPVYGIVLAHKTPGTMTVHSKVHSFGVHYRTHLPNRLQQSVHQLLALSSCLVVIPTRGLSLQGTKNKGSSPIYSNIEY